MRDQPTGGKSPARAQRSAVFSSAARRSLIPASARACRWSPPRPWSD